MKRKAPVRTLKGIERDISKWEIYVSNTVNQLSLNRKHLEKLRMELRIAKGRK